MPRTVFLLFSSCLHATLAFSSIPPPQMHKVRLTTDSTLVVDMSQRMTLCVDAATDWHPTSCPLDSWNRLDMQLPCDVEVDNLKWMDGSMNNCDTLTFYHILKIRISGSAYKSLRCFHFYFKILFTVFPYSEKYFKVIAVCKV